ncbi:alpha-ketoglutarate-dependent dioxygenase AlkB family protein [Shimia biformata]|uniref:alpha-ketoglutarate-dependent dioxygenase AlkB family protein n=1 Tax=Shimia biformata TaxID=1294299 RepID=UPI00195084AD|nr:alpha-ketoglutarate-dependent dioxygenase AlkB [Shimia biformata]
MSSPLRVKGFQIFAEYLDRAACDALVHDLRDVARVAPFRVPVTPSGKVMSVRMTSAGRVGWITDQKGYRYESVQPSGAPWPPVPVRLLELWRDVTGLTRDPDCCLVNYYGEGAKMGLHQDKDEGDFDWPVVSVSLGDEALFRMGNPTRGGSTDSVWLKSGDVVVMGGAARLAYHGIDRVRFGSSNLLKDGGRINVTLRVVAG